MRLIALPLCSALLMLAAPACQAASTSAVSAVVQSDPAPGHHFGQIPIGTTYATQYFSFSNKGSAPITLGQATIDAHLLTCAAIGCPVPSAADFLLPPGDDGCSGKTLSAAASCSLLVAFVPKSGGPRSARLQLPTSEALSVETILAGTGIKQPDDCIFDWAEKTYPSLLSPAAPSFTTGPYYARCYANGSCVGFDSALPTFAPPSAYLYDGKKVTLLASQASLSSMAACK